MSFTYATLKTAIQNYCETSETTFNSNLSVFIKEAEERILKSVEIPDFRKNVTGSATSGTTYLSMPSGPTPDADYSFELHYKYRPASLTAGADGGTTWLSTNAPNALLYGSLVEASTFIKTTEETPYYDQRFQESIAELKKLGEGYGIRDEHRYDISRMG